MSSETATTDGSPELLDERPVLGILVHPIAFTTGAIGSGLIYYLSDHEFTRENARNALNWHLSLFALTVTTIVVFFASADEASLLPAPLDTIGTLLAFLLVFLLFVAVFLTAVFAVVATVKAIFGTAWSYPGAPDLVAKLSELRE